MMLYIYINSWGWKNSSIFNFLINLYKAKAMPAKIEKKIEIGFFIYHKIEF